MDDRAPYATLTPPPPDLRLLRDPTAPEPVVDETAVEHLRNALQLLDAKWATFHNAQRHELIAYEATTIASIRARLQNALDILEAPVVLTGESLASFMHDLAQRSV